MQKIRFGTDGFRGIIAEDFTFSNVEIIGCAIADYLHKNKPKLAPANVIVGFDRRFLSDKFAQHISRALSKKGIDVVLTAKPVPTPAVSCFIRNNKSPLGIIVTASHNPANFNGIKIKNEFGASATETVTRQIEKLIVTTSLKQGRNHKIGKVQKAGIVGPYIRFLKRYLNFNLLKKSHFNIIVDLMYGAGAGIFEQILRNTKIKVTSIHAEHDPLFGGINPEPIAENLTDLKNMVRKLKPDLGIALDGDADRIGAMCPNGKYISSHQAICLLLLHLIENRRYSGRVIKSINTTTMVDRITQYHKIPLEVVPVGFKNIAAKMIQGDVLLGGEESGGIGFKDYMPERDGVLAGLLLLELMAYKKMPMLEIIHDMEKRFGRFIYLRRDLKIQRGVQDKKIPQPGRILGKKVAKIETYDGTKFILADNSWLLIRASGTEPILRIYAESPTLKFTQKLIDFGCDLI